MWRCSQCTSCRFLDPVKSEGINNVELSLMLYFSVAGETKARNQTKPCQYVNFRQGQKTGNLTSRALGFGPICCATLPKIGLVLRFIHQSCICEESMHCSDYCRWFRARTECCQYEMSDNETKKIHNTYLGYKREVPAGTGLPGLRRRDLWNRMHRKSRG